MTDGRDSGGIAAEFFAAMGGYKFSPSMAEREFDAMVAKTSIDIRSGCMVAGVESQSGRIISLTTTLGGKIRGSAFIDAS